MHRERAVRTILVVDHFEITIETPRSDCPPPTRQALDRGYSATRRLPLKGKIDLCGRSTPDAPGSRWNLARPAGNRAIRGIVGGLILWLVAGVLRAEDRFLLAADQQVIEINRAGRVLDVLKHPGHSGIYDAWRLPDGGIAYSHRGGLAVFDRAKKLILDHAARPGSQGVEANRKAFAMVQPGDGSLWVSTSTGGQLLHLDDQGKKLSGWNTRELGLSSPYLLGMQSLANGHLLIAAGDYHLKSADESRDVLAEINTKGKVVWRLTRSQLVDQIEGHVEPGTGLKELHITNVHAYDSERLPECLQVKR